MAPDLSARLAAAAATGGLVAAPSYAIQRLIDSINEPPIGTVLQQATIPYYWRVGLAAMHGLMAAAVVFYLVHDARRAERLLGRLPAVAWVVVLSAAAAVVLRP